jgi:hypothetical protein
MSKVPHPTSICEQWMAESMTHSKMHALQMGLLANDNEWHQALEEVDVWALGR